MNMRYFIVESFKRSSNCITVTCCSDKRMVFTFCESTELVFQIFLFVVEGSVFLCYGG